MTQQQMSPKCHCYLWTNSAGSLERINLFTNWTSILHLRGNGDIFSSN